MYEVDRVANATSLVGASITDVALITGPPGFVRTVVAAERSAEVTLGRAKQVSVDAAAEDVIVSPTVTVGSGIGINETAADEEATRVVEGSPDGSEVVDTVKGAVSAV